MKTAFWATILLLLNLGMLGQTIENKLVGRTFERHFYPLGFKHIAEYRFYHNKVVYSVQGFFVHDTYEIVGHYYKDRFVGYSPQTKSSYILYIRFKTHAAIEINKQGHDPRYSAILQDKPVNGWHTYLLKK